MASKAKAPDTESGASRTVMSIAAAKPRPEDNRPAGPTIAEKAAAVVADVSPFDPARFAIRHSPGETSSVVRKIMSVPVRKPNKHEYFRVHPDPAFQIGHVATIDLKIERETYLILPGVAEAIPEETSPKALRLGINRQGSVFIWPIALPGNDGRELAWHKSAREAAELAEKRWVRLVPDMHAGAYTVMESQSTIADPRWPELSMEEALEKGFGKERIVDSLDHPLIRQLLGQE